jgi:hypothetical protein
MLMKNTLTRSTQFHSRIFFGLTMGLLLSVNVVGQEITSIGDWSCQDWMDRRLSKAGLDAPQMWLSGFLTGLASANRVDALAITDAESVFKWMDKYCVAYPLESISSGALIMFLDLAGRLPRGPQTKS